MAVGGINEDKDNEVGPWFRQTLRLIHDLDPSLTIWPIDHTTRSRDNPLFPSGSKRKRSAPTGRAFLLNVRSPFAIGQSGTSNSIVAKDRGGIFKRGAIAAEIKLDATTTPYTVAVTARREGDSYATKATRRNANRPCPRGARRSQPYPSPPNKSPASSTATTDASQPNRCCPPRRLRTPSPNSPKARRT